MIKLNLFSNLKLKQKFLLSYFALIIIPLFLLSGLASRKISRLVENYITFSTSQAIDQTHSFLSYKLYRISNVSDMIRVDKNISSILEKSPNNYDIYEQVKDMTYLRQYLSGFQDNNDIFRVKLYVNEAFAYSKDNINIFGINEAESSTWYSVLMHNRTKNIWAPSSYLENIATTEPKLLSVAAAIRNPENYSQNLGFLRVDFKKQLIEEIIKKANSVNGSFTYLQNSNGDIIASSDDSLIDKYRLNDLNSRPVAAQTSKLQPLTIKGEKCLIASAAINATDWTMITIVPYSKVIEGSRSIRNDLILLMAIIGAIAYFLAYHFSNSINKRISKLINATKSVHEGNLNTFIKDSSKDEIGELIEDYNFMISRMAVLIEEQYKSGKEVKNAELKALQAQINPHFLYNTLDMINWMSFKNMNKEISEAVKSLAKFYKLSLNKGKDRISIKDELTHVSLYVQIQNMRYSDRISLKIEVDEQLYDYSILKITLQPIVENSILHGILGRGTEQGEIVIKGKLEDNDIILSVTDNGIGIPEDMLDKLLTGETGSKKGSGYGIKNIAQRIKLCYGEKYGLAFESEYGVGTTVYIKIPTEK